MQQKNELLSWACRLVEISEGYAEAAVRFYLRLPQGEGLSNGPTFPQRYRSAMGMLLAHGSADLPQVWRLPFGSAKLYLKLFTPQS
jgi:hypothetical protein